MVAMAFRVSFRPDLINEAAIKRLLITLEKTGNVLILECTAHKGSELGEHFLGDLAEVSIVAVIGKINIDKLSSSTHGHILDDFRV